jgi:hypothetical protein
VSHTFYRKGDGIMSKIIKIVNYIEFSGEMVLYETLSEEKRKETAEKILDLVMSQAGYIKTENKKNAGHLQS